MKKPKPSRAKGTESQWTFVNGSTTAIRGNKTAERTAATARLPSWGRASRLRLTGMAPVAYMAVTKLLVDLGTGTLGA